MHRIDPDPSCAVPPAGHDSPFASPAGMLSGGCCASTGAHGQPEPPLGRRARHARAAAGVAFLVLAGAASTRRLPGRVALWPAALVPAWFGVSHLVASVTGYRGCPEIGAIPSVILGREVATGCGSWERIDSRIEASTID